VRRWREGRMGLSGSKPAGRTTPECRLIWLYDTRRRIGFGSIMSFYASERARLIPNQAPARNVDSKIHFPRFDCCVFVFHSFSAVTFSTVSVKTGGGPQQSHVWFCQVLTFLSWDMRRLGLPRFAGFHGDTLRPPDPPTVGRARTSEPAIPTPARQLSVRDAVGVGRSISRSLWVPFTTQAPGGCRGPRRRNSHVAGCEASAAHLEHWSAAEQCVCSHALY
jgi:hypothetical protein